MLSIGAGVSRFQSIGAGGIGRLPDLVRATVVAALFALGAAACGGNSPAAPSNPLRITSIAPAVGSTTGSTSVTISGAGFGAEATVTVGGVAATSVAVQSATSLTAIVAGRATAGTADVVVVSGGRSATLAGGFTFVAPTSNLPPVVTGFRSIGSRPNQPSAFADLNETITLVAIVTDNETPPGSLTYMWSGPGTFTGTGPTVAWTVPASIAATPGPVVVTLTVVETFVEAGVTHTNRSAPASFTVQVHDSQKEILDLGEDFLTLFSRSEVPVDQVLHNFSTTCDKGKGRADEAVDTARARSQYVQDFSKFRISRLPPVTFNFAGVCVAFGDPTRIRPSDACGLFMVHWE